jgi:hypothetical protein
MNRTTIIQEIINKLNAKIYMEIGVFSGSNFLNIKAPIRIAVDPEILISKSQKIIESLKNKYNFKITNSIDQSVFDKYYEMTSDQFFSTQKEFLEKYEMDVVFIDGSHTYKQTYQDILNALEYLNKNGAILMHDCNPKNWLSAIPASSRDNAVEKAQEFGIEKWSEEWNGDVWKAVVALQATRDDLEVQVIDCDFGIGIVKRGTNNNNINLTLEEINQLDYQYLDNNRERILNLKNPNYLSTILKSL